MTVTPARPLPTSGPASPTSTLDLRTAPVVDLISGDRIGSWLPEGTSLDEALRFVEAMPSQEWVGVDVRELLDAPDPIDPDRQVVARVGPDATLASVRAARTRGDWVDVALVDVGLDRRSTMALDHLRPDVAVIDGQRIADLGPTTGTSVLRLLSSMLDERGVLAAVQLPRRPELRQDVLTACERSWIRVVL